MEKAGKTLEIISTKIVFLIASGMFGCLSFWAIKYSHRYADDFSSEKVWIEADSIIGNILIFLLLLLILYILQNICLRGNLLQKRKRVIHFLLIDMILTGIFATIWVSGSHIVPEADQLQVYLSALNFSNGNYQDMQTYFYMYTQQYGLAFLYECVLWIWESVHLIQYINVLFLLMIIFFGYKLSDILFENPTVNFYTIILTNLFFPLMFYVNFVYGELGTIAMSMCSIWAVLKWLKADKKRYLILAIGTMTLALMVRLNMLIVTVALVLLILVFSLRNKNWKACILAVLLVAVPFAGIRLVEFSYEQRSGTEIGEGMPAVLHIAMGMQQSWQGAGAYNAYNDMTFWNMDGDSAASAQVAMEYIEERIREFSSDLSMAQSFYKSKIQEQWNEGSFGSLIMTNDFEAAPFPLAQSVYGGGLKEVVLDWMERYLFIIYICAFIYSLYGLIFAKELKKTLLPMVAIGGMIFSLLWEAKARYVFPYVTMLLPAVAVGFHLCHKGIEKVVKGVKDKIWTK